MDVALATSLRMGCTRTARRRQRCLSRTPIWLRYRDSPGRSHPLLGSAFGTRDGQNAWHV